MEEECFPLEKILKLTAEEYCSSVGKKLEDFEFKGVQNTDCGSFPDIGFAMKVPKDAEVVINYEIHPYTKFPWMEDTACATGTAVIPKKKY